MLFGPIFSSEMTTTSRRARYFIVRVFYGLVLFLGLWIAYASIVEYRTEVRIQDVSSFADAFFKTFSILQLAAVVFFTPAMTAGTIAQERERRTIEYLFATDLRNSEIILGKLGARLINIFYIVLAGLPILSLTMLLGGIEPAELLAVFIVSVSTMFALASLGIFISVWARRARDAVSRAYVFVLAWVFAPVLVAFLRMAVPMLNEPFDFLIEWTSRLVPVYYVFAWLDITVPTSFSDFLELAQQSNPLCYLLSLWGFPLLPSAAGDPWTPAWLLVRDQSIFAVCLTLGALVAVRRAHLRTAGKSAERRRFRIQLWRPSVGNHPMLWKEVFAQQSGTRLGVFGRVLMILVNLLVIGLTFWAFGYVAFFQPAGFWGTPAEQYVQYAVFLATLVGSLGILAMGARAAGCITTEKERDTWVTLLCTSVRPGEVVSAKILGNFYAQRWTIALWVFIWGMAVLLDPTFLFCLVFLVPTYLVLCLFASTLGLLFSLKCRNSLVAMFGSLSILIFIGGGYLLMCCMPIMIASRGGDEMAVMLAPCMPFLIAMPGVAYFEFDSLMRHDAEIVFAYVIGVIGYGIVGPILWSVSVTAFDRLSGRTVGGWTEGSGARHPRPASPFRPGDGKRQPSAARSVANTPARATVEQQVVVAQVVPPEPPAEETVTPRVIEEPPEKEPP